MKLKIEWFREEPTRLCCGDVETYSRKTGTEGDVTLLVNTNEPRGPGQGLRIGVTEKGPTGTPHLAVLACRGL